MRAQAIDYAAVAVPFAVFVPPAYSASVVQGELMLTSFLTSFHSSCPKTPTVLAGYSQGAHVAGDVFQDLPSAVRASIVGVVLFGDTRFNPAQPAADEGDYSTGLRGMFAGVSALDCSGRPNSRRSAANGGRSRLRLSPG